MAQVIPPSARDGEPASERRVREQLATLDDEWLVFPSVEWQAPRGGKQGDGEADFVLLHPRHGIVVLEVKGGRIDIESGVWHTTNRDGERSKIKNPFRQATDSKFALLHYFDRLDPPLSEIPRICHAVALPDITYPSLGLGLHDRNIVIDATDMVAVPAAVERIVQHWGQRDAHVLPQKTISSITSRLAPTVRARRLLSTDVAAAEQALFELTNTQVGVLRGLRRVRRCVVRGGAGTGKTVLAVEKARRMAADGARVLLTCYNAPLAARLEEELRSEELITVSSFHGLCLAKAKACGSRVPADPDQGWWDEEAANVLVAYADTLEEPPFDALVIDEAQDFTEGWLTALMLMLRDPSDSPVFVFCDSHQQIFRRGGLALEGFFPYELDENCRNTLPIARTVALVFQDPPPTTGAEGRKPIFIESEPRDTASHVQEVVDRLLVDEGLQPQQVVVLSDRRDVTDRLADLIAGGHSFHPLGPGRTGVVAETIHRFKGLESEVVILALGAPAEAQRAVIDSLLYVALSRARSLLIVIGPKALRKRLSLG